MKGLKILAPQKRKIEELYGYALEAVPQGVVRDQQILTIEFPNGQEVIIQPKSSLQPLPVMDGHLPSDYKEAIYL